MEIEAGDKRRDFSGAEKAMLFEQALQQDIDKVKERNASLADDASRLRFENVALLEENATLQRQLKEAQAALKANGIDL